MAPAKARVSCGKGALGAVHDVLARIDFDLARSVVSAMEEMKDPQSSRAAALNVLNKV